MTAGAAQAAGGHPNYPNPNPNVKPNPNLDPNPNPNPNPDPEPNPNQASAEWLNPPSAELAARKVQLVSQQVRALGHSNASEPRTEPRLAPEPEKP